MLNGIAMHFSIAGKGRTVIAHYGGPGLDPRGWSDLSRISRYARLVIIHPRGSGLSGPAPLGGYMIDHYVADIEALCRLLEIQKPILMGWSHGGFVALKHAISFPGKAAGLVLMNTAAHLGKFPDNVEALLVRYRAENWYADSLAAIMGTQGTNKEATLKVLRFYFSQYNSTAKEYLQSIRDLPMSLDPLKAFAQNEQESFDFRADLKVIRVPTLVIAGKYDIFSTGEMNRDLLHGITTSRLEVFQASGHFPFIEEPGAFHVAVEEFIRELAWP
jgi:proline iminopeptidase